MTTAGPIYICQECGDRIQSQDRHDYVTCRCGCSSIDGGSEYTRLGYTKRQPLPAPPEEKADG